MTAAIGGFASPADATMSTLTIDPSRSLFTLSGTATIDFGFEEGPSVVPLESQLVYPGLGASGALIGDGSVSDGLTTSLTGSIEIDQSGANLAIVGSSLFPDIAGMLTPGRFGNASPDAAQLGGAFNAIDLGLTGEMAIRFSEIELTATVLETSVLGNTLELGLGSIGNLRLTGIIGFRTDLGGFFQFGERSLPSGSGVAMLEGGVLAETIPGQGELILPLIIDLSFTSAELGAGLPLTLDLRLQGTLVATGSIEPIPEPSPIVLVGLGLGILAARTTRRGPERTWNRILPKSSNRIE